MKRFFFAGLHCRHHANYAIGIGERSGSFRPQSRPWLPRSAASAASAAVLLLRRLEQ